MAAEQNPGAMTATVGSAEVLPLAVVEEYYRRKGNTLISSAFMGWDPFDFWVGRFYVGFFGFISILGAILGTALYLYAGMVIPRNYNIITATIEPPLLEAGLRFVGPAEQGFYWQWIVIFATIAFIGWLLREVDICRKLDMTYEVPLTYGAVVTSWITLQFLRPIAMGAWGNGFTLGITAHLNWVSNIGYAYWNFFYNPFHMLGIFGLFGSTMLLAMHGSAIRSVMSSDATVRHIDAFWRGIVGYSIGEIGIHRVAFWAAVFAVLVSNVCIWLSGTLVQSWSGFWSFWDRIPIWSLPTAAGIAGVVASAVVVRRRRRPTISDEELEEVERGGGPVGGNIGKPIFSEWMQKVLGAGQIGPFNLGIYGAISVFAFTACVFFILFEYLRQVGYNPILFLREFPTLAVNPPPAQYGLGPAGVPWTEGGVWLTATFFLTVSIGSWWLRIVTRARQSGVGWDLAKAFTAAIFLYAIIYIIRPMVLGSWTEAPGHGLKVHLDWVNYINLRYGNFYYNPFHMLSIFFLLGSTMLLGMHGATIVATAPYGAEDEIKEMRVEGSGTHRAQLFWRWAMGFNANATTIHHWIWWFAILCVVTGGIGLLLSGTVINDWYQWGIQAHIVPQLQ